MVNEQFDVAVIGSGPGGSVCSTFLAKQGYKVVLLEREEFPRFHVGESLLPGTQPIWERMGIADKLQHSGHTFKYAGEFRVGRYPNKNEIYSTIGYFHNVPRSDFSPRPYAYQVERAVFDKQLQDCAVEHGVTLWEKSNVLDIQLEGRRATGIKLRRHGEEITLKPKFIVDASGRRCMMGRKLDCIVLDPVIKTSAAFGHFRGVTRDPGYRQGFFNGYFVPHGWLWFIPLSHDIMSVGTVQNQPATNSWSNVPEENLLNTINKYKFIQDRFRNAVQVGRVRGLKDLAYTTTTFTGENWLSIGDANFFVDPLYSSGVQIAHTTGEVAAEAIGKYLMSGGQPEGVREYERYIVDYRKRVFRPMRSFYRCMRNYKTIAGYVASTGSWFDHFNNWFLRRACSWGTGRFHRHHWTIQLMSLMGNVSAIGAPLIGMGGWKRYEDHAYTGPALQIPKAPELVAADDHTLDNVPITQRYAQMAMANANANGHDQLTASEPMPMQELMAAR